MVYLTRIEHFNAAHKLFNPQWSTDKNLEVFGKCSNPNWHGHNYELHVTIKGEINSETGYVFNAKILSKLIKEYISDVIDHKNINIDVPFMQGKLASSENLIMSIWQQLKPHVERNGAQLHKMKLYETPNIYVEYYG